MAKVCIKCAEEKSLEEFVENTACSNNREGICIECRKIQCKKYRDENKEKMKFLKKRWYEENNEAIKIKHRKYREENKEKVNQQKNKWYEDNKKEIREYQKEYYKKNQEKVKLRTKKYREENKEKVQAFQKEYKLNNKEKSREYGRNRRKDPMFRVNHNISSNIGHSLRGNKNGRHWENIVGYTLNELKEHLESKFQEGMTWGNYGAWKVGEEMTWHIDHFMPIDWFDFDSYDDIEFKMCWDLDNLQPKWADENLSKNNRFAG